MAAPKRKGKATGPRTEVFALRLDPKLKYLAEIAARTQRRSLASYVEWGIESALRNTTLDHDSKRADTVWDSANRLWDLDEPDRLVNLAFVAPNLMTYEEQILWKLIRERGYMWNAQQTSDGDWEWVMDPVNFRRDRLREYWSTFKKVAAGELGPDSLPEADGGTKSVIPTNQS